MEYRKYVREDAQRFYPTPEDIHEAEAMGFDWKRGIQYAHLFETICIDHNGFILALGGCDNTGSCWFVTHEKVATLSKAERKEFREAIVRYRDECLENHKVLHNTVWIGNQSHIRLLTSIGAIFGEPKGDFVSFTITKEV